MYEDRFWVVIFILGMALIIVSCLAIFDYDKKYEKGYKQGQIDAINGKIVYEIKENENKEKVWNKKDLK